jgi:biopolymer transport protein ExbD
MKVNLEPDDLDVRIEMIPLIDIIFCILVFFLLGAVTTGTTKGLNVDLPKANSGQPQLGDPLKVEVDVLGQIIVQNTVISQDQLSQLLATYVAKNPEGVVVFQADRRLNYETVMNLFDLLRKVGGTRVALATTDRSATPQSLTPGLGMPSVPNPSGQLNLNQPTLPNPLSNEVPVIPTSPTNPNSNPAGVTPVVPNTPNGAVVPKGSTNGSPNENQSLQNPGTVP